MKLITTKRTKGDARKSCRIFAADAPIFDELSYEESAWYFRLLMSVAEQQSDTTDFYAAMISTSVIAKLIEVGLVDVNNYGKVIVLGASRRLNKKDKERKTRYRNRVYERELSEIVKSIIKNEKPEGTPDEAIVWGGNKKRWGVMADIKLAIAVHKHVSKYNEQFAFGITLINQCRLLRVDFNVSHENAIELHKAINNVFKCGGKITINNMREELSKAGL